MSRIVIDEQRCKGCLLCVEACPKNINRRLVAIQTPRATRSPNCPRPTWKSARAAPPAPSCARTWPSRSGARSNATPRRTTDVGQTHLHQGQRGHRLRRPGRRLPLLLRLPHHPPRTTSPSCCLRPCPPPAAPSSRPSRKWPRPTCCSARPPAACGAMTTSSSPGVSLMQEAISYMAGSELPGVLVNMNRGGPGLGDIGPSQGDYFQSVKGGGHGDLPHPGPGPGHLPGMLRSDVYGLRPGLQIPQPRAAARRRPSSAR